MKRSKPHAQVHLQPLTAEEALLVVGLLERAVAAIWRTHGDAMAEFLACHDPDAALLYQTDPDPAPPDPADLHDDDIPW
jgi:hypothetical protein